MKKVSVRLLFFVTLMLLVLSSTALAANSTWREIGGSASNPIVTYPIKSSGVIYGYSDSALTKQKGYIDCATDECWIIGVRADGKAVQVSYPVSGGRAIRWFRITDFFAGLDKFVHTIHSEMFNYGTAV